MYVYTGRGFSADAWFASMKQGHTFVTNGPMLTLAVDGAIPGDELKTARSAIVRIRARAWAPASIGSPKSLEVVAHGEVIRSAQSHDPDKSELEIEFDIQVDTSQWIAARVEAQNGALAHTSPVYVVVEGESFRNKKELPRLVEKRLRLIDFILGRLHDPKYVATFEQGEVDALTDEIEEARARYKRLL